MRGYNPLTHLMFKSVLKLSRADCWGACLHAELLTETCSSEKEINYPFILSRKTEVAAKYARGCVKSNKASTQTGMTTSAEKMFPGCSKAFRPLSLTVKGDTKYFLILKNLFEIFLMQQTERLV